MKLKWVALILFLIIIPVSAFYIGVKYQKAKEIRQSTPFVISNPSNLANSLSVNYINATSSLDVVTETITKPVVSIQGHDDIADKINRAIDLSIKDIATGYIDPLKTPTQVIVTSTTTISHRFDSFSVELDSIASNERMTAPEMERQRVLTFDLKSGEIKPYYEILAVDQMSFLGKLASLSRTELKEKYDKAIDSGDDGFLHGTDPRPENYEFILLGDNSLTVNFSLYQIGSKPLGSPSIDISYDELGV